MIHDIHETAANRLLRDRGTTRSRDTRACCAWTTRQRRSSTPCKRKCEFSLSGLRCLAGGVRAPAAAARIHQSPLPEKGRISFVSVFFFLWFWGCLYNITATTAIPSTCTYTGSKNDFLFIFSCHCGGVHGAAATLQQRPMLRCFASRAFTCACACE